MAGLHGFQPVVYHEMEDVVFWPPVDEKVNYSNSDIDAMARFAMSNNNLLLWDDATSSPSSVMSQSVCNTDPIERPADVLAGSEGQDALNFGLYDQASSQWRVQEQDPTWQSLDQRCNQDRYAQSHDIALQNTPLFARQGLVPAYNHSHIAIPPTSNPEQIAQMSPIPGPLPDVFASTRAKYQDPPTPSSSTSPDAHPQPKSKRCSDDLYTPRWVRNTGTLREGWCGWCASWFTLRDSAYWYHMHYSHGVAQANNGKLLPGPAGFRSFGAAPPVEWEVRCGKCARWMPLPPGDKWNTAYFRHTYKCYFKAMPSSRRDRSGPSSPTKAVSSPARRRADMP